jgi:LysM repeat protein
MTTQTPNVTYYVVRSGDTLTAISKMYETTVDQLVEWNHIPDPDFIKVGQKLIVAKSHSPHETLYTVRKGDTLTDIAKMYGTTVDQLVDWNPDITDPDVIRVGQRLVVARSHSVSAE